MNQVEATKTDVQEKDVTIYVAMKQEGNVLNQHVVRVLEPNELHSQVLKDEDGNVMLFDSRGEAQRYAKTALPNAVKVAQSGWHQELEQRSKNVEEARRKAVTQEKERREALRKSLWVPLTQEDTGDLIPEIQEGFEVPIVTMQVDRTVRAIRQEKHLMPMHNGRFVMNVEEEGFNEDGDKLMVRVWYYSGEYTEEFIPDAQSMVVDAAEKVELVLVEDADNILTWTARNLYGYRSPVDYRLDRNKSVEFEAAIAYSEGNRRGIKVELVYGVPSENEKFDEDGNERQVYVNAKFDLDGFYPRTNDGTQNIEEMIAFTECVTKATRIAQVWMGVTAEDEE